MPANSYTSKLLRATLILPAGSFPGTANANTLTLTGYRMLASVQAAAGFANKLHLTVFGMRQDDMNAVTILWSAAKTTAVNARALIVLEASPDGVAWTQVFSGNFVEAAPDYTDAPNVALRVLAMTGNGAQIQIAPPTSYPGVGQYSPSVVSIAQYLAGQMGFKLENNGVTGTLSSPYFPGTLMDQFRALCDHANLDFYFDGNGVLAICPKNQPRLNKPLPVFSPTSGLIGFPTVQRWGIHCDVLWTPALAIGANLQVAGSLVPGANGTWLAYNITHDLESLVPDGAWFSRCDCL